MSGFHEGPARRIEGLGFLPWSNAVHYCEETERRAAFEEAVAAGMPPGYGVSDGAALHFVGTELSEVVSSRQGANAVYVAKGKRRVVERKLPARYLGGGPRAMASDAAVAA